MGFRNVVLVSHRWLGLSAAVVLSITGLTGLPLIWPTRSPIGRMANRLHENLALGAGGQWVVATFSAIGVVLLLSGPFLWWKQQIFGLRPGSGWRRMMFDLHQSLGILGWAVMLVLAVTGIGMAAPTHGEFRRTIAALHNARSFSLPVQVLYALGTVAFLVEAVSGVLMWWKPWQKSARR